MVQDTSALADRVAIISDPHANLRGVELCYKMIKSMGIDQIFCCGDIVGYGNEPNQVVEFFRSHDIRTISGNHDRLVCDQCEREKWSSFALEKVDWTKSVIADSNFAYLYKLPPNMLIEDCCIVHGAWSDHDKYLFAQDDFLGELKHLPSKLIFCGHTHIPCVCQFLIAEEKFDYRYFIPDQTSDVFVKLPENSSDTLVSFINPGTVGYPRGMNDQASFVVWDRKTGKISYHFYQLF